MTTDVLERNATDDLPRLYWQCRRGMLELDLLLLGYMDKCYKSASLEHKQAFNTLLSSPDQLLLEYLMGHTIPIDKDVAHVAQQVREAAGS